MLKNAYLLAKIGADTAENEQHFAEILPTDALAPRGPPPRLSGFPVDGRAGRIVPSTAQQGAHLAVIDGRAAGCTGRRYANE